MALIQKQPLGNGFAIQSEDIAHEGIEYYTKAELRTLMSKFTLDEDGRIPAYGTFDDDGNVLSNYPDDWLGVDELDPVDDDNDQGNNGQGQGQGRQ